MKSMIIFLFCLFFGFLDMFYLFFLSIFFLFFVFLDLNPFYFGGIFFCDYLSFFLIFLSLIVFLFCIFTSSFDFWLNNHYNSFLFFLGSIFLLLFLSFFSFSIFLFYVFFEAIFFLMFLFLLSWGYSPERLQASFFMIFYTIVVSLPFLFFIILSDSFFLSFKFNLFLNLGGYWWFFVFFVFLVKLPSYGVHLWLPKAHVEAPVTGSMVLAGVLLKLGGYGFYRMTFYLLPSIFLNWGYFFSLGLLGGLYSSVLCLRQYDLKSFVAYSSVCHMGYFLAGFYSLSFYGVLGGIYMLVAHGFCSSALFYLLYVLYERFYSRSLFLVKGLLYYVPSLVFWIFVFSIFNMGVPPSFSFFSEVFITVGLLMMNFSGFLIIFFFILFAGVYGIFFYTILGHGLGFFEGGLFVISHREILNFFCHLVYLLFIPLFLGFF